MGFVCIKILLQVMDKPSEATLVGRGPRPKTVKLAGAEGGLSITGHVALTQTPIPNRLRRII